MLLNNAFFWCINSRNTSWIYLFLFDPCFCNLIIIDNELPTKLVLYQTSITSITKSLAIMLPNIMRTRITPSLCTSRIQ